MKRVHPLVWLLLPLLAACTSYPQRNPTLDELQQAVERDEAEAAGGWLMDRPEGLNPLDGAEAATPLVAVHGYGSKGTEWVGPLAALRAPASTWYRWDWLTCPDAGAAKLTAAIDAVAARPGVQHIRIVGHSYGGLISALAAHRYAGSIPLEVHVIAAPLAGVPRMNTLCGTVEPGEAGAGEARITQWRTVHAQDGAFRDLETDPQVVPWAGDDVVQLPAEWNGGRLGHNRSIQWVAEALKTRGATTGEPAAPADDRTDRDAAEPGGVGSGAGAPGAGPAGERAAGAR